MGTIRKYGLAFIVILTMTLILALPDFILRLMPSFTDNPLDLIFIILITGLIIILWKA